MSVCHTNRLDEMTAFITAVDEGGFSAAARKLNKTPSALSKLISRLEERLNVRLFQRSTRQLQLTHEGEVFYQQCKNVLNQVEEAEQSVYSNKLPAGLIRISCNIPLGKHYLIPLLNEFHRLYPDIQLNISLTDHVDLISETVDVAIRSGHLKDSNLIARKLGETKMVIVASREYIKLHGKPKSINQLLEHERLGFNFVRYQTKWPLIDKGKKQFIPVSNTLLVSNGDALKEMVLHGLGIARLAMFQVKDDITAGNLVPLLEKYNASDSEPIHAVFLSQANYMPARVRALIDFLVEKKELH